MSYGGVAVPKSPFNVNIGGDTKNIRVYGPGVEPGVKTNQPTFFTIDCTEAGRGENDSLTLNLKKSNIVLGI